MSDNVVLAKCLKEGLEPYQLVALCKNIAAFIDDYLKTEKLSDQEKAKLLVALNVYSSLAPGLGRYTSAIEKRVNRKVAFELEKVAQLAIKLPSHAKVVEDPEFKNKLLTCEMLEQQYFSQLSSKEKNMLTAASVKQWENFNRFIEIYGMSDENLKQQALDALDKKIESMKLAIRQNYLKPIIAKTVTSPKMLKAQQAALTEFRINNQRITELGESRGFFSDKQLDIMQAIKTDEETREDIKGVKKALKDLDKLALAAANLVGALSMFVDRSKPQVELIEDVKEEIKTEVDDLSRTPEKRS
jgi:hypothetical protein